MYITEKTSRIIKTAIIINGIITVMLLVCGAYFFLKEMNSKTINVTRMERSIATTDPSINFSDSEQIADVINTIDTDNQQIRISSNIKIVERETFAGNKIDFDRKDTTDVANTIYNHKKIKEIPMSTKDHPMKFDIEFTSATSNFRDDFKTLSENQDNMADKEYTKFMHMRHKIKRAKYEQFLKQLSFSRTNPRSFDPCLKSVVQKFRLIDKIYVELEVLQILPETRKYEILENVGNFINTTRKYLQPKFELYSFSNALAEDIFEEHHRLDNIIGVWEQICGENKKYLERDQIGPEINEELMALENLLDHSKLIRTLSVHILNMTVATKSTDYQREV